MPDLDTLLAFVMLSVAVTLAPGPDNLMVLGQSLSRGLGAGLGIALGCALGCFTHTLWATLGVSAVLAASPNAFLGLKLAGAAYLLWLGVQAWRSSGAQFAPEQGRSALPWWRYLVRGFIANAINPKVALFFLAFLPQFVRPDNGPVSTQMILLGLVFALQTIVLFGLIAATAARLGKLLLRQPALAKWLDRGTGTLFIGLAAHLALTGRAR